MMNKKTYMSPEMEVIEINMNQQILAGSTIPTGDSGSANDAEAPELFWYF